MGPAGRLEHAFPTPALGAASLPEGLAPAPESQVRPDPLRGAAGQGEASVWLEEASFPAWSQGAY